jgi:hypothetical protein
MAETLDDVLRDLHDSDMDDNHDTHMQPASHHISTTSTTTNPFAYNPSPSTLQKEVSGLLTALNNLQNTASFVTSLGDDLIKRSQRRRLLAPIKDLQEAVAYLENSLNQAGYNRGYPGEHASDRMRRLQEADIVTDRELFFKWISNCTMCILAFQARLEEETQKLTEWISNSAATSGPAATGTTTHPEDDVLSLADDTEDDDDDEWTILEKDETGNVHSLSMSEKDSQNASQKHTEEREMFAKEAELELMPYSQQLKMFLEDLSACISFVKGSRLRRGFF